MQMKFSGVALCREPWEIWINSYFGRCFLQLSVICPVYAVLTIVSAFYIGQKGRVFSRLGSHHAIINIRIILTIILFLCSVSNIMLELINSSKVYIADYVISSICALSYIIHTGYLCNLKEHMTENIRGPSIVLFSFMLCLISSLLDLASIRKATQMALFELMPAHKVYITLVVITVQILYCLTLLPKGETVTLVVGDDSISFPSEARVHSMSSLCDHREDTDLGIAENGNIFSRIFFMWIKPILQKGYEGLLENSNSLFELPETLRAACVDSKVSTMLQTSFSDSTFGSNENGRSNANYINARKSTTLLKYLHKCFGWEYYLIGLLKLLSDGLNFAGPLLLNFLVSYLERKEKSKNDEGYYYAFGLLSAAFFGAIFSTQYSYFINRVSLKIRAAIITVVYRKALGINRVVLSTYNTGEIVNFVSTDTDRIVNFCQSFHQFWSLPLQVVIILYFLYTQIGFSFLVGVAFAIMVIPLNHYIAKKIGEFSKCMLTAKDKRIKLMNEILCGIKIIKMQSWEDIFFHKAELVRESELNFLKKRKYLDAICVYLWATTPLLIAFLTFTTYVLLGNSLSASKIFTSIAFFNMLIMPLNAFPWVLNGLVEAWVSLKRIEAFLKLSNHNLREFYEPIDCSNSNVKLEISNGIFEYSYQSTEGERGPSSFLQHENAFRLGPICLSVPKGKLVCITGRVGSGKSTLLYSILGDITCKTGKIGLSDTVLKNGIGFVSQDSWIQQASVRENILFGQTMDDKKYQNVLESCALLDDLQILPHGDRTEVGEKGMTLSGGQRARLSLARALYQDLDMYLIDDPFASVDVHVAEHIFKKCIMGILKNKTCILCTHHLAFIERADYVIALQDGKVVVQGLPNCSLESSALIPEENSSFEEAREDNVSHVVEDNFHVSYSANDQLVYEEERDFGVVKLSVYKSYWKAAGVYIVICVTILCTLMQVSRTLSDWWLSFWIANEYENMSNSSHYAGSKHFGLFAFYWSSSALEKQLHISFYLSIYGMLVGFNCVCTAVRAFLFAYACIKAASYLHKKLLRNLIEVPSRFFDCTPLGRILNRFSTDMYNTDDTLPFAFNILLAQTFSFFGCVLIAAYGLPWIILIFVPLSILYFKLQNYYRCTSRELKRLSCITLSPIYVHFSETLSGHSIVRSLGSAYRFHQENMKRLDDYHKTAFATMAVSQWLNLRLQFIGVTIVTGVAVIALLSNEFSHVDPGLVGLTLSYALSLTSLINGAVTAFTETEKEIVSVERILQYAEGLETEKQEGLTELSSAWPSLGIVHFINVYLKYRPNHPHALYDITFKTKSFERLGIVGRTGSGKSSLLQALFRMTDINHGAILIDNINIYELNLKKLRSNLSIIPQDPFLFSGSIKENIDPDDSHSDEEVWDALKLCCFDVKIRSLGGLSTAVGERGENFSSGEKQLICLARTLLHKYKVLCMDEATANIDYETETQIHTVIKTAFKHATVLIITHRLKTVMDCDRIVVMDEGKIQEINTPYILLNDSDSKFYQLAKLMR